MKKYLLMAGMICAFLSLNTLKSMELPPYLSTLRLNLEQLAKLLNNGSGPMLFDEPLFDKPPVDEPFISEDPSIEEPFIMKDPFIFDEPTQESSIKENPFKPSKPLTPNKPFNKKPIPQKPIAEITIPKINIQSLLALDTGYLKPLELMKSGTPEENGLKNAQAKGILNGLLNYTKSDKFKPQNLQTIQNAVERILAIDPLLISTAAIILRQAKNPVEQSYNLMENLYEQRINFIEKEIKRVTSRSGIAHKGLREDVDEALSYPIELEGEIQKAKTVLEFSSDTGEKQKAQNFLDTIDKLRKRLLELLKKPENKEVLTKVDLPVDFYIDLFENKTNQVYCITEVSSSNPSAKYKPFIDDLKEIVVDIKEYKEGASKFQRSLKIYKIQSIINKLKGFLAHATESSFCQICLQSDIEKMQQLSQMGQFDVNQTFKTIEEFLQSIYDTDKNEAILLVITETLPKLKKAIEEKGCSIN